MRDSGWRGTLDISARDVDLRGTINAVLDFDVTTLANGETTHQWGTVEATLDGASCEGNVGNTDVPSDEDDDDGAFVLTCEDGSALFGRVHDWADRESSNAFTVTFELDGWYLPSAAA